MDHVKGVRHNDQPAARLARLSADGPSISAVTNSKDEVMRRIALVAVAVTAVAGVAAYMGSASGQSNGNAAPIYGIKIPDGYRDWRLISVKQLTGKLTDRCGRRAQAVARPIGQRSCDQGISHGNLPFPDGTIIAALHWNEKWSDFDNQALATGFPGLGLQSSFAGSSVNVQFMVKDSKKYAASGGWGFADFTNGKPGNERCTQCASPATSPQKIATMFSLTTRRRPELKRAGRSSGRDQVGLLLHCISPLMALNCRDGERMSRQLRG